MGGVADSGGLVVVAGHGDAARVATLALYGMQHRGSGGAALAVADGVQLRTVSGLGRVEVALPPLADLMGSMAVGCVWTGDAVDRLVSGRFADGRVVGSLVGRVTNASTLRNELLADGVMLRSGSDTEVLVHLIARSTQRTFVNRLVDAVWKLEGAYVLAVCTPERLVVLRDPSGFRPVWLGRLGEAVVISTDDAAIVEAGGRLERPLGAGEMLIVDERGVQGIKPLPERPQARCTQEMVSLASAHSRTFGEPVHRLRVELGRQLAEAHPCPGATVVIGMPGAGEEMAVGVAAALGLPRESALFEVPPGPLGTLTDGLDYGSRVRLRVLDAAVRGQRVVLVSPPVGGGDRIRQAIARLQAAGALSVDLRCAAPPVRLTCPYGITMPGTDTLASSRHPDAEDLASWLGAASVAWLRGPDLESVLGERDGRCEACLSGILPVDVVDAVEDDQLTLFS